MKKLCIYHGNCADGFGAAWVVRKRFGEEEVEFVAGVYQQPPPDCTGRDVIIVDFSYKRHVIETMIAQAKSFVLIDHHKSAFEDLKDLALDYDVDRVSQGYSPVCLHFDMEHSGAMLAWKYYFGDAQPPKVLQHIEDRDLWRFKLEGTKEIQIAVFSYPYDFKLWDRFMEDDKSADTLEMEGESIERKHMKDIEEFLKVGQRRMFIGGHNVPVCSLPYFYVSEAGHIMAKGEPFAACYWDTPDGRIFGLRSTDDGLDVSAIARRYGGGGHRNASGFKIQYCQADHHVAHPIKVFQYTDASDHSGWYCGVSVEEIKEVYFDDAAVVVAEIPEAELDVHQCVGLDGKTRTFREELMLRIGRGDKFPQSFAEPLPS